MRLFTRPAHTLPQLGRLRTLLILGTVIATSLCLAAPALGANVTINGVVYTTNDSLFTASVTGKTSSLPANVTIPSTITDGGNIYNVTSIGGSAFFASIGLQSITLPTNPSFVSIGDSAFQGTTSLTSITIPDSVTTIGQNAFSNSSSLTQITVGGGNPNYASTDGVLFNKNSSTLITYPMGKVGTSFTIPNTVTTIGYGAFSKTSLPSITIPVNVVTIGDLAFTEATRLTSITFTPTSRLNSIGASAFIGATSLTSITIPDTVANIGSIAFERTGLTEINVGAANTAYASADGVLFNKFFETLIAYPTKKADTSYTIPNTVITIKTAAFIGVTSLTSITIPNSVTTIEDRAFAITTGLTSITIPNSVTTIENNAFRGATSLRSVTLSTNAQFTRIERSTFEKTGLTSITIPNNVTTIGDSAFRGATSLPSITIPNSVTTIDDNAFAEAASLASVTLPTNIGFTSIAGNTFAGTTSLTSITIPSNVTTIDYGAFSSSGLTSITIPNSVTSIGDSAFYEATSLKSITIPTSGVIFGDKMFYGASSLKLVRALGNAPDCTFCSHELFSGAPATLCRYPSASGWPAMNALYFGIPQADLSTSACAKSESTSSGISTGSTTKTPTGSMTARTRCAASGLCTTTGTVPAGTDHVTQTATSSKSQIVKTTCTISKKTSYVCKLRLGPGSWRLTTQARSGSKRGPKAITHAKLKTKRPTAVTG